MIFDNHFSEIAVLSTLLKSPNLFDRVKDLDSQMFTSTPNTVLFKSMQELYQSGVVPESNLVLSSLLNKGSLSLIGGQSYIEYLLTQSFSEENFEQFLSYLIQSYKARTLLTLSSKIPSMVSDVSTIDSAIDTIESQLRGLKLGVADSVIPLSGFAEDVLVDIKHRADNPNKITTTTGFSNLDMITTGFSGGELWILAGRPGMGKSAMMCNMILSGEPSLVFSLEMNKISLVHRLLSMKTGIPIFDIRLGDLNSKKLELISGALDELKSLPLYFDSTFSISPSYIYSTIRKYKKIYDIKVVHLDYIQLLVERSTVAVHELGQVSRELKTIANDIGITSVLYSQLNRAVEGRDDKRPMLSDLRQSGNLEEDADIVIFLYRDSKYNAKTKKPNELEIILSKQRNGPTGTIFMKFDEVTNRIIEEK